MSETSIDNYPIGAKVRLDCDYPDEEPREVAGYRKIYGFDYLVVSEGFMAFIERAL